MIKADIINTYWIKEMELDYNKPVEIYGDHFPTTPIPNGIVRICISHEPHPHLSVKAFEHPEYYTWLLTWKEEHLTKIPNSVFFFATEPRVKDYKFSKKGFGVSTVVGEKDEFEGHRMRQSLYFKQNEITIPTRFYISGTKLWKGIEYTDQPLLDPACKDALWDTQFHIAIENLFMNNWFTEKILDCFLSKTVPVYIGAPNIRNFFNERGIIICNNLDDVINFCNRLTPELYLAMSDAIEDNYNRAFNWIPHMDKLRAKINQILKKC